MDDAVWTHAVFSKNRDRPLTSDVAQRFFAEVNKQAKKFMTDEHFTEDGTLIQALGLAKSMARTLGHQFSISNGTDENELLQIRDTDIHGSLRKLLLR